MSLLEGCVWKLMTSCASACLLLRYLISAHDLHVLAGCYERYWGRLRQGGRGSICRVFQTLLKQGGNDWRNVKPMCIKRARVNTVDADIGMNSMSVHNSSLCSRHVWNFGLKWWCRSFPLGHHICIIELNFVTWLHCFAYRGHLSHCQIAVIWDSYCRAEWI